MKGGGGIRGKSLHHPIVLQVFASLSPPSPTSPLCEKGYRSNLKMISLKCKKMQHLGLKFVFAWCFSSYLMFCFVCMGVGVVGDITFPSLPFGVGTGIQKL